MSVCGHVAYMCTCGVRCMCVAREGEAKEEQKREKDGVLGVNLRAFEQPLFLSLKAISRNVCYCCRFIHLSHMTTYTRETPQEQKEINTFTSTETERCRNRKGERNRRQISRWREGLSFVFLFQELNFCSLHNTMSDKRQERERELTCHSKASHERKRTRETGREQGSRTTQQAVVV